MAFPTVKAEKALSIGRAFITHSLRGVQTRHSIPNARPHYA